MPAPAPAANLPYSQTSARAGQGERLSCYAWSRTGTAPGSSAADLSYGEPSETIGKLPDYKRKYIKAPIFQAGPANICRHIRPAENFISSGGPQIRFPRRKRNCRIFCSLKSSAAGSGIFPRCPGNSDPLFVLFQHLPLQVYIETVLRQGEMEWFQFQRASPDPYFGRTFSIYHSITENPSAVIKVVVENLSNVQ